MLLLELRWWRHLQNMTENITAGTYRWYYPEPTQPARTHSGEESATALGTTGQHLQRQSRQGEGVKWLKTYVRKKAEPIKSCVFSTDTVLESRVCLRCGAVRYVLDCTTAWVCSEVPEAMLVKAQAASNWRDGLETEGLRVTAHTHKTQEWSSL